MWNTLWFKMWLSEIVNEKAIVYQLTYKLMKFVSEM